MKLCTRHAWTSGHILPVSGTVYLSNGYRRPVCAGCVDHELNLLIAEGYTASCFTADGLDVYGQLELLGGAS